MLNSKKAYKIDKGLVTQWFYLPIPVNEEISMQMNRIDFAPETNSNETPMKQLRHKEDLLRKLQTERKWSISNKLMEVFIIGSI